MLTSAFGASIAASIAEAALGGKYRSIRPFEPPPADAREEVPDQRVPD
jgi:hypothetical protein